MSPASAGDGRDWCAKLRRAALDGSGVLARRRRRRAVARLAGLGTPEAARALAEVLVATTDPTVAEAADAALRQVRDQPARDAVCEVLLAADHLLLGTLVREHGWAPSDPARRVVALLLAGELERCAELDVDGSLFRSAYAAADEGLRARLAGRVREAGRPEWMEAVAGRRARRGGRLTAAEWDALTATLAGAERFVELWRLAMVAPPEWSARLLRTLDRRGWRPAAPEGRAAAGELYPLARAALAPAAPPFTDLAYLPRDGQGRVCDVAVDPAGTLLATVDDLGEVQLWHLPSGEPGPPLNPAASDSGGPRRHTARSLTITPDGRLLAASAGYGTIRLWRLPSGEPAGVLYGNDRPLRWVHRLAVTPDASLLISVEISYRNATRGGGSTLRTIGLWPLPHGTPTHVTYNPDVDGYINRLAVTPDGAMLVASGWGPEATAGDIRVSLRRLPSGERVGARFDTAREVVVSPDGKLLLADAAGGILRRWRLPSGEPVAALRLADAPPTGAYGLRFPPEVGAAPSPHTHDPLIADRRRTLAVGPYGRLLARAGVDGVGLWLLPSGEKVGRLESESRDIRQVAFSHDGRVLIGNGRHTTTVWRLPSGEPAGTLSADMSWPLATPSGTLLVSRDPDGPGLWVRRYRPSAVETVARTPVAEITPAEIEMLHRPYDDPGVRALAAFAAALVRHFHARDIELADGTEAAPHAADDIEASG